MSNTQNTLDGRHSARADESIRIKKIAENMNENTDLGRKMKEVYLSKFGKNVAKVTLAGSNKDHYDIVVHHEDGTMVRVEEKHSEKVLDINMVPWKYSVQVLNGVGNHYEVGRKYARIYYDTIITKLNWRESLQCEEIPEIPSYEEWVKDAFRCGDPKTPFVKKLKSVCRETHGPKSSFTGQNNTLDVRSMFPDFELSETEITQFLSEINAKLQEVMSQKDCFLQTKGNIDNDDFEFVWRERVECPEFTKIQTRREKDIFIDLYNDNGDKFTGILRWGKGCGFTNIRFDVR